METNIVITKAKITASLLRNFCQVLYMVLSSLVYSKLQGIEQALLKLTYPTRNSFSPKCCPVLPLSSPSSHYHQKTRSHPYQQVEAWSSNSKFLFKILTGDTSDVHYSISGTGPFGKVPASSQMKPCKPRRLIYNVVLFLSSYTDHRCRSYHLFTNNPLKGTFGINIKIVCYFQAI